VVAFAFTHLMSSKRQEQVRQRQEAEARECRRRQEQLKRQQEAEARQRLQRQEQQRLRQQAEARERLRRQEELRRQQAAAEAVSQCQEAWQTPEHQALLARFASAGERLRLETDLESLVIGSAKQTLRKAADWQERFERVLKAASRKAAENSRAVAGCLPLFQSAMKALGELNTDVLTPQMRKSFDSSRSQLRQRAEAALSDEDLANVQATIQRLKDLAAEYQPEIKAAEMKKAVRIWQDALASCGYSVVARTGPDGSIILEGSSFPMKSLSLTMRPDSPEVRLDVDGEHDHSRCVNHVQSLQAELGRRGVQLTMTDWGKGKPGLNTVTAGRLSVGGAK